MTKDSGQFRFDFVSPAQTNEFLKSCPHIVQAISQQLLEPNSNFVLRGSERCPTKHSRNSAKTRRDIELFRVNNSLKKPVDRIIISYLEPEGEQPCSENTDPNKYSSKTSFLKTQLEKLESSNSGQAKEFVDERQLISQIVVLINQFTLTLDSFETDPAGNSFLILERIDKSNKSRNTNMRVIITAAKAPGIAYGINDNVLPL